MIEINDWQQKRISNLIVEKLFGTLSGKKISILGFAFKANTNDTRESPAIKVCHELLEEGVNLSIFDPQVNKKQIEKDLGLKESQILENPTGEGSWSYCTSVIESTIDADAILILTEWEEFQKIKWDKVAKNMRKPSWIFDTRCIAKLDEAKKYGMNIWRIGINFLNN